MPFRFNPFTDKLDLVETSSSPTGDVSFLSGNTGGMVPPDAAHNINTIGTGSITIAGNAGTNTLTTQLTGLTNHSLLVGAGTATITNLGVATNGQLPIGSTGADPVLANITSTGGTITVTNGAGTINLDLSGGSSAIDSIAVQTGVSPVTPNASGLVTMTGAVVAAGTNPVRTDGTGLNSLAIEVQTSQALAAADATKIGLANFDSTSFAVSATGFVTLVSGGFTWINVTGTSATMVKENGYQANNAGLVTLTMPSVASSTFGDTIKIGGLGSGGWLIQCVATQLIHFGSTATSAAGSLASTNRYDQIELVCSSTTTEWFVRYAVGNLTTA